MYLIQFEPDFENSRHLKCQTRNSAPGSSTKMAEQMHSELQSKKQTKQDWSRHVCFRILECCGPEDHLPKKRVAPGWQPRHLILTKPAVLFEGGCLGSCLCCFKSLSNHRAPGVLGVKHIGNTISLSLGGKANFPSISQFEPDSLYMTNHVGNHLGDEREGYWINEC